MEFISVCVCGCVRERACMCVQIEERRKMSIIQAIHSQYLCLLSTLQSRIRSNVFLLLLCFLESFVKTQELFFKCTALLSSAEIAYWLELLKKKNGRGRKRLYFEEDCLHETDCGIILSN